MENNAFKVGFGAQFHHWVPSLLPFCVFTAIKVYALILGLASNRTVVVERGRLKYLEEMEEWCGGKGTL